MHRIFAEPIDQVDCHIARPESTHNLLPRTPLARVLCSLCLDLPACGQEQFGNHLEHRILLDDAHSSINASRHVMYTTSNSTISLAEIQKTTDWKRSTSPVFNQGFTQDVYWLRMQLHNPDTTESGIPVFATTG